MVRLITRLKLLFMLYCLLNSMIVMFFSPVLLHPSHNLHLMQNAQLEFSTKPVNQERSLATPSPTTATILKNHLVVLPCLPYRTAFHCINNSHSLQVFKLSFLPYCTILPKERRSFQIAICRSVFFPWPFAVFSCIFSSLVFPLVILNAIDSVK